MRLQSNLGDDALAGTITAILLIPQALAYAMLAGLPPEIGLYASVAPPIIYALTGSSRTLAVGPVAVAAVMVAAALGGFANGDPARAAAGAGARPAAHPARRARARRGGRARGAPRGPPGRR